VDRVERNTAWIDGKRIEGFCRRHGYSSREAMDLREMHRLHLMYPETGENPSPLEVLAAMAGITPSQKALLMKMGKSSDPRFSAAFIRLAEDTAYAKRVLEVYQEQVRPALNL